MNERMNEKTYRCMEAKKLKWPLQFKRTKNEQAILLWTYLVIWRTLSIRLKRILHWKVMKLMMCMCMMCKHKIWPNFQSNNIFSNPKIKPLSDFSVRIRLQLQKNLYRFDFFFHDVYLLLFKRSERIDEPILRKANNSVIS